MLSPYFLTSPDDNLNQMDDMLTALKKAGADEAEIAIGENVSFDMHCRMGHITDSNHAEGRDLSLRAFIGKRKADVHISLDGAIDFKAISDRIIAMAKAAPEDPFCGLAQDFASRENITAREKMIDVYDSTIPLIEDMKTRLLETENTALAEKAITNSEGASLGWSLTQSAHMTSLGFIGCAKESAYHTSCVVLAEKNGQKERDYESDIAHFEEDMSKPALIGKTAANRARARLGAVKPKSCQAPIIYHPRCARSLLGHFAAAISGASIARGASFLKDGFDKAIFSKDITIIDDPNLKRGLRSQAFDDEGVLAQRRTLIDKGVLTSWLMDCPSARQLGLASTGHSSNGAPSPTNLWLEPSSITPEELMGDIAQGLYVSELIGSGVNPVTGDYSRGASGFWIENGQISHPVCEISIVGNLKTMFETMRTANDFDFRYGIDTPSLRVEHMTIAAT